MRTQVHTHLRQDLIDGSDRDGLPLLAEAFVVIVILTQHSGQSHTGGGGVTEEEEDGQEVLVMQRETTVELCVSE